MSEVFDVFKNAKKHVLAGISYLIPVIVVGGICCGLGVAIGGTAPWETPDTLGYFFFMLGKKGLNLMPAVMAAFIGYSIADKGAIAPGLIIGQVSQECGAGFLGGIVAGFYVGVITLLMKKVKVNKNFSALWAIIVIPTVASVTGAYLMQVTLGPAITAITNYMISFMDGLGVGSMVLVGAIIGFFGSLDFGLFMNKAFGAVALAMMSTIDPATGLPVMAAQRLKLLVVSTAAISPLVCCLARYLKPSVFNEEEKEAATAAGFMGLFGITEGAIPLGFSDKIIYAGCVLGNVVACIGVAIIGAGSIVNWGGIPNLPGNTNPVGTVICWLIGVVVGAMFVVFFKKTKNSELTAAVDPDAELKVTQQGDEIDIDL